jgi:hypothetical protein
MTAWRNQYEWYNPGGIFGSGVGLREQRGGVVQTDKGPRVEVRRPDGSTTLGYLDASRDADLNPGAILADHQNRRTEAKEGKLERLYGDEAAHQRRIQTRQIENQTTQLANAQTLGLAGLQQRISESTQQYGFLAAQLAQQGRQSQNSHDLAVETLRQNNLLSSQTLALKGMELQANIGLRRDDQALRREEIANMRAIDKRNAIMNAAKALLLPRG